MPGEYESVGLLSPYPTRVIYLCVNEVLVTVWGTIGGIGPMTVD